MKDREVVSRFNGERFGVGLSCVSMLNSMFSLANVKIAIMLLSEASGVIQQ